MGNLAIRFFFDLTNIGMLLDIAGVLLVAYFGIPRNNEARLTDEVVVSKTAKELKDAKKLIHKLKRREMLGFILIILGFLLMLIDRNIN